MKNYISLKENKNKNYYIRKIVVAGVITATLLAGTVVIAGNGLKSMIEYVPSAPQGKNCTDFEKTAEESGQGVNWIEGGDNISYSSHSLPKGESEKEWNQLKKFDQMFEYKEIKVKYIEARYLCVTEDYVISIEEQKAIDNQKLYIEVDKYGGIDVVLSSMFWVLNGENHLLQGMDASMTAEEMFEMAKEIIDTQLSENTSGTVLSGEF